MKNSKKINIEKHIKKLVKQYFQNNSNITSGYLYAELIQRVERELIKQVLKLTDYNQYQTAKILGISRTTLRKKINNM